MIVSSSPLRSFFLLIVTRALHELDFVVTDVYQLQRDKPTLISCCSNVDM